VSLVTAAVALRSSAVVVVAFGPTPRSHAIDLPKKVRALALKHASRPRQGGRAHGRRHVKTKEPRPRRLRAQFSKLEWLNALIIDGADLDQNFALAARNIPQIDVLPIQGINVADILAPQPAGPDQGRRRSAGARFA